MVSTEAKDVQNSRIIVIRKFILGQKWGIYCNTKNILGVFIVIQKFDFDDFW